MEQNRTKALAPLIGAAAALAAWIFAAMPALRADFLADDYDVGGLVHAHAERFPGFGERIFATFTSPFGERFEVYRPLTLLSIQCDYALYGADGGAHHATNLVLWLLVAAAAGAVAGRLARRGVTRAEEAVSNAAAKRAAAAGFAFALGSFAAVECAGWLVAREDLLVALFGLLAWRAQLARPASWTAPLGWLVLAFLSKDSAVVLPPALLWARLFHAPPDDGARRPELGRSATLRKAAPFIGPFAVLALYMLVRLALFGTMGSKYLDRSYGEWIADGNFPGNFAASMARLVAPWNDAWNARTEIPTALRFVFPATAATLVALGALRRRRRIDGRTWIGAAGFLFGTPLLTSPMYGVAETLQQGRTLALPAATLAALLGLAAARATAPGLRARAAAAVAAFHGAFGIAALWFHLAPFLIASLHAREILGDLRDAPPGTRIAFLGLRESNAPPDAESYRPQMSSFDGAYVLSGGLGHALRPPFRSAAVHLSSGPAVAFDPASGSLVSNDAMATTLYLASPPADQPCGLREPRFRRFAPADGAPIATFVTPDLRKGIVTARLPSDSPPLDRIRFFVASELGRFAEATVDARGAGPGAEIQFPADALLAAATEVLRGAPRFLVHAAHGERDGRVVLAQPWAAVFPPR